VDHGDIVKNNLLDAGKKEDDCKAAKAVMQARVRIKKFIKNIIGLFFCIIIYFLGPSTIILINSNS
jgi:hypothetical protein